jgi:hypothetical protein
LRSTKAFVTRSNVASRNGAQGVGGDHRNAPDVSRAPRSAEHVDAGRRRRRAGSACELAGHVAGAGADVEDGAAGGLGGAGGGAAPAGVHAEAHQAVHAVVARDDAAEHGLDAAGVLGRGGSVAGRGLGGHRGLCRVDIVPRAGRR